MFDRADFPYTETFVREAIQNTLDARLDETLGESLPGIIKFSFHQGELGPRKAFLDGAVQNRKTADFPAIDGWADGKIDWVSIEDFNTRGLDGKLDDRLGNFWNYWLNFGVSNKGGAQRGGRGIGRVTFLIASQMQTVLALTRRSADGIVASCGMTILRTMRTSDGVVRTTHAYLAENEQDDVFKLHDTSEFNEGLAAAFRLNGYSSATANSGLALIIPYPHSDLSPEGILASSIEHFAPAILNGSLVVQTNDTILDKNTIDAVAISVAENIRTDAIKADVVRYLELIRAGLLDMPELIVDVNAGLAALRETEQIISMQSSCERGERVSIQISFELQKNNKTVPVSLRAVIEKTPDDQLPIDRFFREGMSLPDVRASTPGEYDLVLLADDENLANYLNLCEGKAHLDLLESKEIKAKLEKNGYQYPVKVKRFIKSLPNGIRSLMTPEITEPEIDVFDAFFALPDTSTEKKKSKGGKPEINPPPPLPPPPPRISPLIMETLADGFRITANPAYINWPVNVSVSMAYADGTRNPAWSIYDFSPNLLPIKTNDCDVTLLKNRFTAKDCGPEFLMEVTGFDALRELDTNIKVWRNAQNG